MKRSFIAIAIITISFSHAGAIAPATGTVSFKFNTSEHAINGDTALADQHDSAIDEQTTATAFSLTSVIDGLSLTVTPSQSDISYTTDGLGIDTGGDLSASGDALIFSFNKAITFDFIDLGSFTGAGDPGDDEMTISFSNGNPTITLVEADFTDSIANTVSFTSGNTLAAGESFTISFVNGNGFTLEGFNITVVPEPATYAMLTGILALGYVITRRHHARM